MSIGDTPNRLLLAVSDAASSAALSGSTVWTFFFVQQNTVGGGDSGEFLDYPSLGVDVNALYVGGNMFDAALGTFVNFNAYVIRKSSALSGGPLVTTAFRGLVAVGVGADGPDSPRGVDNYDPAAAEGYIIGPSHAAFGRLILRRIGDPGGTPAISANVAITVPATSLPISVDHLGDTGGASGNLDAIDDRLFVAHIRNGRLWTAHTNAVTAAGVSSNSNAQRRDGVRWYELNVPAGAGTPTVVQSGTIFDSAATVAAARQYWMGSAMVSGQGHAALGFSTAGTPFRADAATVGRLEGDTLSTTQTVSRYHRERDRLQPAGRLGTARAAALGRLLVHESRSEGRHDDVDDPGVLRRDEQLRGPRRQADRSAARDAVLGELPSRHDSAGNERLRGDRHVVLGVRLFRPGRESSRGTRVQPYPGIAFAVRRGAHRELRDVPDADVAHGLDHELRGSRRKPRPHHHEPGRSVGDDGELLHGCWPADAGPHRDEEPRRQLLPGPVGRAVRDHGDELRKPFHVGACDADRHPSRGLDGGLDLGRRLGLHRSPQGHAHGPTRSPPGTAIRPSP